MVVEECLRELEGKAALLEHWASAAARSPEISSPTAFNGLSDVCRDIVRLVRAVKGVSDGRKFDNCDG